MVYHTDIYKNPCILAHKKHTRTLHNTARQHWHISHIWLVQIRAEPHFSSLYPTVEDFELFGTKCDYSAFQTFRQSVFLRFIWTLLLFLFEVLCIQQDKTTRHLGIIFSKFSKKEFLIFFDKTHESMGLYNGKMTTTMPLLCYDPDSVDGETSWFRTASHLQGVSQKKLTGNEVYFSIHKSLLIHGNQITQTRASLTLHS